MTDIKDEELTREELIEKLKDEASSAYGIYMYYECADREYDFASSRAAFDRYCNAIDKLKELGVDYKR